MKNIAEIAVKKRAANPVKPKSKKDSSHLLIERPTMLLVLGMHRSGTSVTARLLECLGAVNSTHLMPPAPGNNEKGFFEDLDISNFNELKFLPNLGASWHSLGIVDWSNLSNSARSKFALEALEILRKNYSLSNPLSVLKEPRLAILLPFWLSVLRHAGFNPKIICAVRDPASVARSLSKRDGFSITKAGMLYVTNWISILSCIQDLPVAFVQFDEVFSNPTRVLRVVADKLSVLLPADFDSRLHSFSSSFFDASLRHSTLERRDLTLEADLPPLAIELYESLLTAAQSQNVKKTARFLQGAEDTVSKIKPVLADFDITFAQLFSEKQKNSTIQSQLEHANFELEKANRAPAEAILILEKEALLRGQLAERLTAMDVEKQRLSAELEGAREQNGGLESQVGALAAERSTLLAERDGLATERDELQFEKQQLCQSLDNRFQELAQLTKELLSAQEKLAAEDQLSAELKNQYAEMRGQFAQQITVLDSRLSGLTAENASLSAERSTLDARLLTLLTECDDLATERDVLSAGRDELAERLTAIDAEKQTLSAELEDARKQNSDLAALSSALAAERSTLEARISTIFAERDSLASECSTLHARLSTLSSEHSSLVTSHSSLVAERDELAARHQQLAGEKSALTSQKASLSAEVSDRFEEIALLSKRLLVLESERDDLATGHQQLVIERNDLATGRDELAERLTAMDAEKQWLSAHLEDARKQNSYLASQNASLTAEVSDRFEEIALLGKRLLVLEAEGNCRAAAIQARLDALASRLTWKLGAPFRATWDKTRNTCFKIYRLPTAWRILRLHRSSGFFNHEWYYRQNPDVKATTDRPFLHFAFHGVFEGRAPNPSYNESTYLKQAPSAQSSSMKPLLHYTLKGWKGK